MQRKGGLSLLRPRLESVTNGVRRSFRRAKPEFADIKLAQEITDSEVGALRTARFSKCGQLLATGGINRRIYLYCSQKAWTHFTLLRTSENVDEGTLSSCDSTKFDNTLHYCDSNYSKLLLFAIFEGHTDEVIDLAWSRYNFLLSISLDKTVRLWHASQIDCLLVVPHADYISAACFMPADDRYFVSACFDGYIRLWSIPRKTVLFRRNVTRDLDNRKTGFTGNIVTALTFLKFGDSLVAGTADGRLLFYRTDTLEYITQAHICKTQSPKVLSIEVVNEDKSQLLVTSADSRVRLFSLMHWRIEVESEFKGCTIGNSTIRADMSPDGQFIVCGSEDFCSYVWDNKTPTLWEKLKKSSAETIISGFYEENPEERDVDDLTFESLDIELGEEATECCEPTQALFNPTFAFFAPNASLFAPSAKYVLVSVDHYSGRIRVFIKTTSANFT